MFNIVDDSKRDLRCTSPCILQSLGNFFESPSRTLSHWAFFLFLCELQHRDHGFSSSIQWFCGSTRRAHTNKQKDRRMDATQVHYLPRFAVDKNPIPSADLSQFFIESVHTIRSVYPRHGQWPVFTGSWRVIPLSWDGILGFGISKIMHVWSWVLRVQCQINTNHFLNVEISKVIASDKLSGYIVHESKLNLKLVAHITARIWKCVWDGWKQKIFQTTALIVLSHNDRRVRASSFQVFKDFPFLSIAANGGSRQYIIFPYAPTGFP